MPLLSVILPVFNVEAYIGEAVSSILAQTFSDFELIIIDDCSTDKTVAVAESFNDNRIRIYVNELNKGRAYCDNKGHSLASGEYFAKMDGDDICHPRRFEKQLDFLAVHPEINTVGSAIKSFGASTYLHRYPATPDAARAFTLFTLPAANNAVIFKSRLFTEQHLFYDETLRQTEDYDFCARYLQTLSIANLPDALVRYRMFPPKSKNAVFKERFKTAHQIRGQMLERWGISNNAQLISLHNQICHLQQFSPEFGLKDVENWLQHIIDHNKKFPWFNQQALSEIVGKRWFEVCYHYPHKRLNSIQNFYKSSLSSFYKPDGYTTAKFFARSIKSSFKKITLSS